MKLRKIRTLVVISALIAGNVVGNKAYSMASKKDVIKDVNYHMIRPFWNKIHEVSPTLSVDGTTLYPSVYIEANSYSGKISGTMYLEKYSSGNWVSVTSWNLSGTINKVNYIK